MAAPNPNSRAPPSAVEVRRQPPALLAAADITQKNGIVRMITHSADLPMLANMNAVRALITSATARTVQILARCAAKPSKAAHRQQIMSTIAAMSIGLNPAQTKI